MLLEKNPVVSIICLCYNHENYVLEALQTVKNQTYSNIEIIIIDDCSTDNSVGKIKNWLIENPEVTFIQNKTNLGNTKTFNLAAKHAKGKYLVDFATDDVLLPNFVEKLVHKFENTTHRNLGLIYSNVANIDEKGNFINNYFETNQENKVIENRPTGNIFEKVIDSGKTICSVSAMFTREVFEKLNGFDENLAYEDLDFWIRLSREYEIDFVDEILVEKRVVKNSLGSQFHNKKYSKKINFSTYLILQKTYKLCDSKKEYKNLLKRIHYEILLNLKHCNYVLVSKLAFLKFKTQFKTYF